MRRRPPEAAPEEEPVPLRVARTAPAASRLLPTVGLVLAGVLLGAALVGGLWLVSSNTPTSTIAHATTMAPTTRTTPALTESDVRRIVSAAAEEDRDSARIPCEGLSYDQRRKRGCLEPLRREDCHLGEKGCGVPCRKLPYTIRKERGCL